MEIVNYLKNEMLLNESIPDIDYEFCYEPHAIGITTKIVNGKKKYFVYEMNERCIPFCIVEQNSFFFVLSFAREFYEAKLDYIKKFKKTTNNNLKK